MKIGKYSPKWLLNEIRNAESDAHALFKIIEFQKALTEQCDIHGVMPRFLFGEWVLVDKKKSGQIIECYGNSCIIDENGMWTEYQKERLTKDTRYLTPSEYYESNGA